MKRRKMAATTDFSSPEGTDNRSIKADATRAAPSPLNRRMPAGKAEARARATDTDRETSQSLQKLLTLNQLKLMALSIAESDYAKDHTVNSTKDLVRCPGKATLIRLKTLDYVNPGQFERSIADLKRQLGRAPNLTELMAHFSQSFATAFDRSPQLLQRAALLIRQAQPLYTQNV